MLERKIQRKKMLSWENLLFHRLMSIRETTMELLLFLLFSFWSQQQDLLDIKLQWFLKMLMKIWNQETLIWIQLPEMKCMAK